MLLWTRFSFYSSLLERIFHCLNSFCSQEWENLKMRQKLTLVASSGVKSSSNKNCEACNKLPSFTFLLLINSLADMRFSGRHWTSSQPQDLEDWGTVSLTEVGPTPPQCLKFSFIYDISALPPQVMANKIRIFCYVKC